MKKVQTIVIGFLVLIFSFSCSTKQEYRKISLEKYRSKMKAGWLGQMAGVGWGAPTEFKFNGVIIPKEQYPKWDKSMVNQQFQDDLYVEMTFLKTLEDNGFDVSIRKAGIDFANSRFQLWHANKYGRENLRNGIAPPYSGHPKYNSHSDDIDYQIEADYSGLISPGMPQMVVDLGDKFGRIMNYGDGVYGGQFVGGMYAEAFFSKDINHIIKAGLDCIPSNSQYAEAVNDVIKWHKQNPKDWKKTWNLINEKYNLNHDYRKFSCNGTSPNFNIDAKINGAFIVMGLLYGEGDMDKTIEVSMRCGMDSDCNPSSAAGVLAVSLGLENLPAKFKSNIDDTTKYSFTDYTFPKLLEVCEMLSKKAVVRSGGKIEKNSQGEIEFLIPKKKLAIKPLEQSWNADSVSGDVNFTKEEMAQIVVKYRKPDEFVSKWFASGPYKEANIGPLELFDFTFLPEENHSKGRWVLVEKGKNGYDNGLVDLNKLFRSDNCVGYLKTSVWMDKAEYVNFELGSDDGVKVWVNNNMVHSNNVVRGHNQGEDQFSVELKKGWNEIFMKITQGNGGWEASLILSDKNRKSLKNLKYK